MPAGNEKQRQTAIYDAKGPLQISDLKRPPWKTDIHDWLRVLVGEI